eukprot:337206_1
MTEGHLRLSTDKAPISQPPPQPYQPSAPYEGGNIAAPEHAGQQQKIASQNGSLNAMNSRPIPQNYSASTNDITKMKITTVLQTLLILLLFYNTISVTYLLFNKSKAQSQCN